MRNQYYLFDRFALVIAGRLKNLARLVNRIGEAVERGDSKVFDGDSSEEEIEVKLPKQKKSGADGNDELYRRAFQRMFELH